MERLNTCLPGDSGDTRLLNDIEAQRVIIAAVMNSGWSGSKILLPVLPVSSTYAYITLGFAKRAGLMLRVGRMVKEATGPTRGGAFLGASSEHKKRLNQRQGP